MSSPTHLPGPLDRAPSCVPCAGRWGVWVGVGLPGTGGEGRTYRFGIHHQAPFAAVHRWLIGRSRMGTAPMRQGQRGFREWRITGLHSGSSAQQRVRVPPATLRQQHSNVRQPLARGTTRSFGEGQKGDRTSCPERAFRNFRKVIIGLHPFRAQHGSDDRREASREAPRRPTGQRREPCCSGMQAARRY